MKKRFPWIETLVAVGLVLFLGFFIAARSEGAQPRCVVEPGLPMSNRVIFLFDRSGSMAWGDNNIQSAIATVNQVITQPLDDLWVGIYAFDRTEKRWGGIPEEGVPAGWAALPSEAAVKAINEFMTAFPPQGGTRIMPALTAAMQDRTEVKSHLTIVIVSDGLFEDTGVMKLFVPGVEEPVYTKDSGDHVKSLVRWREEQKLKPASIWFLGIQSDESDPGLISMVKTTKGGYYMMKEK